MTHMPHKAFLRPLDERDVSGPTIVGDLARVRATCPLRTIAAVIRGPHTLAEQKQGDAQDSAEGWGGDISFHNNGDTDA